MKLTSYSYHFAEEIVEHPRHLNAWTEIEKALKSAPLFIYPNKSSNKKLDVVQQVMNRYYERVMLDLKWEDHPLATNIKNSKLKADFKKKFGNLTIQAEFQFGNMARWYSDVFKFQTAYSQSLINMGLSVVPMGALAKRIDSNVANFERVKKELPSADLSITLPILVIGLEPDEDTPIIDISACKFSNLSDITGKGKADNQWRIVNGYLKGVPMKNIDAKSPIGSKIDVDDQDE